MWKLGTLSTFLFLFLFTNIHLVLSLPAFYDGRPLNNTYTYGKDSDIFSINISDSNLNSTSVVHHIRVYEAGTNLTNTSSSCSNLGSGNWYCSNTVLGFGSLGGDGKNFIFYFDAKNTTGSSNSSENYFVTIDRSAPQIFANSFLNNSYISGNFTLTFTITDAYSGVNSSSAQFIYGNTTFNSTPQSFTSSNPFSISFDTRNFVNNSTYFLYVNVSDNIGNVNITKFVVYVENEPPTLSIILPTTNSTMRGITYFQITSTDSYSGLYMNSASYILDSTTYSIPCTGTNFSSTCTSPLVNTSTFTDGLKTINFSIVDNAGNLKSNSTTFYIDNNPPSVSISNPSSGSVVRGLLSISATITEASGINISQFRWENTTTVGSWTNMTCSGTTCNGTLDTTLLADGNYTLKINATDNGGLSALQSVQFVIDNTKPNIVIIKPDVNQQISGIFVINITTTDNYGLAGNSSYSVKNTTGSLTCVQKTNIQTFSCSGSINSSIFSDGTSTLSFTTTDLAGNTFSNSVDASFDNLPPQVVNVTVEPPTSKVPTKFTIKGYFSDSGSSVSSATTKINLPDGKSSLVNFTKKDSYWQVEYSASDSGKYTIDVTLVDANSHSGTYSNVASFFIGISKCGDSICDPTENYCTCSQDCSPPSCKDYQLVNCKTGVPICGNKTGCGNEICESSESCSTCEIDCGKCAGNQTGGFNIGTVLAGSTSLILLIIVLAVGGVLAYLFWPKQKPVYPGFKPKNKEES